MFWKQLFAKKSLETLHAEAAGENRLRRILGPINLTSLGIGAIIGAGIFVMTGRSAAARRRAGHPAVLRRRRPRLPLRRPLLRRVRLPGPGGRQRLHLRLRHPGRAARLDHRLGPDPRIRHGLRLRRRRPGRNTSTNSSTSSSPGRCRSSFATTRSARRGPGSTCRPCSSPLAVTVILVIGIRESATTNAVLVGSRSASSSS